MLLLKYLLLAAGIGLFAGAAAIIAYDIYLATQLRRLLAKGAEPVQPLPRPIRWKLAGKLAGLAWLPLLLGLSIVVVADGSAGCALANSPACARGRCIPACMSSCR